MSPKILLLDIETSPMTAYTWTAFDASALKILEFSKVISVAWKYLGEEETYCKCIHDYKGYKKGIIDDEKLVAETWRLLDNADIVIAHHGDSFDLKKLAARFVYYGLGAPSSYKSVDTKKAASKYFRLDSNSLNNIAAYLNLGAKVENGGFGLWDRCIQGDKESWELMKIYNKGDVTLLEKVYLALRPFMENHPNLNAVMGTSSQETCPTCLSTNITKRGFAITRTGRKQRFQCQECGSWSSGPYEKVKGVLSTDDD